MGKREKEQGAQHATHVAYFRNMRDSQISLAIVENVTEYSEALVKRELGQGWDLVSVRFDPRCLGLPTSRARVFMICWRVNKLRWVSPFTLGSFIGCLASPVVMNAGDYFFKTLPKSILSTSAAP